MYSLGGQLVVLVQKNRKITFFFIEKFLNSLFFSRFSSRSTEFPLIFSVFPHGPSVHGPPNSDIFSRFFLTTHRILTSFLGFSSRFSGPRSTEFSHLFTFFPHGPPNSHFFSRFFLTVQRSTVHRILTSFHVFSSRSTEFSLLFSFFPLSFGVISCPIRSRHVDPVEICCWIDTYGPRNSHFFSRFFLRNLFVPGQLLESFSSNQITTRRSC